MAPAPPLYSRKNLLNGRLRPRRSRPFNQLVPVGSSALPALVTGAGERAHVRFPNSSILRRQHLQLCNPHTRRAYYRAADEFLTWCANAGVRSIATVQPVHVATWIEARRASL
jgi:hypothetical protein